MVHRVTKDVEHALEGEMDEEETAGCVRHLGESILRIKHLAIRHSCMGPLGNHASCVQLSLLEHLHTPPSILSCKNPAQQLLI